MLTSVGLGGADRPFFRSLWRWPRICRSSVSTRGRAVGGLGAVDQVADELTVAHHVELEPEGLARILGDILNQPDGHGREREGDAELLGGAGLGVADRGDLGLAVRDLGDVHIVDDNRFEAGDLLGHEDALLEAAVGQLQLFQPFMGLGLAALLLHEQVSWRCCW